MVVCPNCSAENRSGAKFCKLCAARLPVSSAVTLPLDLEQSLSQATLSPNPDAPASPDSTGPSIVATATRRLNPNPHRDTRPLHPANGFLHRPPGALFADTFLLDAIKFSDEQQHRYRVRQIGVVEDRQIQVCPNIDCGAIFLPRNSVSEKFCTDCGSVLEKGGKDLELVESSAPVPENLAHLAAKGLSHGTVRAPLAAFVERLAGISRHCLVISPTEPLESAPDALQALRRGIALARGLEYLHENGVTFNGKIDGAALGMVGGRAVWAGFAGCEHLPDGFVVERRPDAEALAMLVFSWMTGKTRYERDPGLALPAVRAFDAIFAGPGIHSGVELAEVLENALEEMASVRTYDFIMGRRTHVGMVRTLNEDSLMSLEINRIHQSISEPLGVYVVADGMGGHAAGEVASGAIINAISQKALQELMPSHSDQPGFQDRGEWLRQAVWSANNEVYQLRQVSGNDMGSTLVSVVLDGNKAFVTHVGDSRAYRLNAQGIWGLTVDHSLVERLIASNQITREEARKHPQRNVIYRTVGDKADVEIEVTNLVLEVGDFLLLCSDGLSGMVDDQTMWKIVLGATSPQDACDALVRAANDAGGDDNISVIIVKVVEA